MHHTSLNKHGLPLLRSSRQPTRTHHVLTPPPHLVCHDPNCSLLTRHTISHSDTCDTCLERQFDDMIWRTY